VIGSIGGALFGPFIKISEYGLSFALPSLFICLLVFQLKSVRHLGSWSSREFPLFSSNGRCRATGTSYSLPFLLEDRVEVEIINGKEKTGADRQRVMASKLKAQRRMSRSRIEL